MYMKKLFFIGFTLFCLISCEKQPDNTEHNGIEGITMENYPYVDGSTSTDPLNYIIASRLLKIDYEWLGEVSGYRVEFKNWEKLPMTFIDKFRCYQTHGAILNLFDYFGYLQNPPQIIIVARKMSAEEKNVHRKKAYL